MRKGEWRWEKCLECGGSGYSETDPSGVFHQSCFCKHGRVLVPTEAWEERMRREYPEEVHIGPSKIPVVVSPHVPKGQVLIGNILVTNLKEEEYNDEQK